MAIRKKLWNLITRTYMEINLISNTIPFKDSYANMWWPDDNLKVVKNIQNYSGTTVFVDDCIPLVNRVTSKKKVAWLIEPPVIKSEGYELLKNPLVQNCFDLILTFDENLVKSNPEKIKLFPFGACWISEENCKIHKKSKLISIVASNKNYAPGHRLRHSLISSLGNHSVDLYGTGYNEFPHTNEGRLMPFKDYMFSIVIENSRMDNYFTDKIVDCLSVGTVPLYWGAPNIDKYFDVGGILNFDSIEDCLKLLNNCTQDYYNGFTEVISKNFNTYKNWASPDKNLRLILQESL